MLKGFSTIILLFILSLLTLISIAATLKYTKITSVPKDGTNLQMNLAPPPKKEFSTSEPLVVKRVAEILDKQDAAFSNMLINRQNWIVLTHPQGLYSLSYPKQVSLENDVCLATDCVNLPYTAYHFTYKDYFNFSLNISFDMGGGGSLCANSACYNILEFSNVEQMSLKAYDTYNGVEERLVEPTADYVIYGINFEPRERSKYMGRISGRYGNGQQREVIKQILESLILHPENFKIVNPTL